MKAPTLEEVLALAEKATGGPWSGSSGEYVYASPGDKVAGVVCSDFDFIQDEANAKFIAAAVNYLRANGPELLAMEKDAARWRFMCRLMEPQARAMSDAAMDEAIATLGAGKGRDGG